MLTTIIVHVCYAVKNYKNKPKNIFIKGGRARCGVPGSAFENISYGDLSLIHKS